MGRELTAGGREFLGAVSGGEPLRLRVHAASNPESPTLVYLPGLHGDWTIVGALRAALDDRACFAELTYPRTVDWSLTRYAEAIEELLVSAGLPRGWVLAESFGSQIAWPLCARARSFTPEGLILAGGFGRHPLPALVRIAQGLIRACPGPWFRGLFRLYVRIARWRFRHSPTLSADLDEFLERRTEADRAAALHRTGLILANQPTPWARQITVPVHYLTGMLDPVVPWPTVPGWLRDNCAGFRDWSMIPRADHNVLGTGARPAAEQILKWIGGSKEGEASATSPAAKAGTTPRR